MLEGLIQFSTLKEQQYQEILTIIIQANRNTFPLLVNKYQSIESFEEETRKVIQACFTSEKHYQRILNKPIQYNYGIRINGRLVAVMLGLDLIEQYKFLRPLLDDPSHVAQQFASEMFKLGIQEEPGTAIYFSRLSVLPQMIGKGIGKKLVYQTSKYLSSWGYQYAIVGTKVKPSLMMFTKLGGEMLGVAEAVRPTFTYQINIMKNNFRKLMEIVEEGHRMTDK